MLAPNSLRFKIHAKCKLISVARMAEESTFRNALVSMAFRAGLVGTEEGREERRKKKRMTAREMVGSTSTSLRSMLNIKLMRLQGAGSSAHGADGGGKLFIF